MRNLVLAGRPLKVRAGGVSFQMMPAGRTAVSLWRDPAHRCEELQCLTRLLKPDSIFVCVGSSAGLHALAAAASSPKGKCYVFEPVPEVFAVLKKNINLNRADPVVLINAFPAETGDAGRQKGFFTRRMKTAKPIDEFVRLNGIEKIDVLRVEAGGEEWPVLRGAEGLLIRPDAPAVIYETSFASRAHGYHPVEIMWYLEKLGYALFVPRLPDGQLLAQKPEYGYTGIRVALKPKAETPALPERGVR